MGLQVLQEEEEGAGTEEEEEQEEEEEEEERKREVDWERGRGEEDWIGARDNEVKIRKREGATTPPCISEAASRTCLERSSAPTQAAGRLTTRGTSNSTGSLKRPSEGHCPRPLYDGAVNSF
jgi:hypothetical protein